MDTTGENNVREMIDFNTVAKTVSQGGVWQDEQSLDWTGETGSHMAAIDKNVVHTPKTHKEVEQDILTSSGVSAEIVNIISGRVERSLLRSSGSAEQTIIQMVNAKITENGKTVSEWIDGQNARMLNLETKLKDTNKSHIDRIDEKLASLELKLDAIVGSMTQHGPEEVRMLHEAYKIIVERKSSDEGDTSEPSIYRRMENRISDLNDQLKSIEPFVDDGIKSTLSTARGAATVRKRFGKMM